MQARISRLMLVPMLAVGVAGLMAGCASTKSGTAQKEVRVSLAELSAPARAAVEKVTAGGKVDQIDKEIERGKTVYDVEATVGFAEIEGGHGVRALQQRNGARFALEARFRLRIVGAIATHDFERDVAMKSSIMRAVNLTHASRSDEGDDLVRTEARSRRNRHCLQ